MIGSEPAGHVSPSQHRTTISGYVIYVTVSWLLHRRPERLLKPTTSELVSTQYVGVCGRLGFVVVGRTWLGADGWQKTSSSAMGTQLSWFGPSTIGRKLFSRTNQVLSVTIWWANTYLASSWRTFFGCCCDPDRSLGGQGVMIWGGISAHFRTELIVVPGNLTGIRYRDEILDPVAVPLVCRHDLVFQQDNARPHTARVAATFLQQHNNTTLIHYPGLLSHLTCRPLNTLGHSESVSEWIGLFNVALNSHPGLMSDGPGAGQRDGGWKGPRHECTGFLTRTPVVWSQVFYCSTKRTALCDILDRRVSSHVPPPNTIAQVQEALKEEWETIPQQHIRRLVHSMQRRLTALIQANGGHTRSYWLRSVIRMLPGILYFCCSCVFVINVWWFIAVLWIN